MYICLDDKKENNKKNPSIYTDRNEHYKTST